MKFDYISVKCVYGAGAYYIEKNTIKNEKSLINVGSYRNFNDENLYELFLDILNLNIDKDDEILAFYGKYGMFGVPYIIIQGEDSMTFAYDDLAKFKHNINVIKGLLQLKWMSVDNCFSEGVEKYHSIVDAELSQALSDEDIRIDPDGDEGDFLFACREVLIPFIIERELAELRPKLSCNSMGKCKGEFEASSLKVAAYFALFTAFSENAEIRICANDTCKKYFKIFGKDTRKIFCSNRCATLVAKRNQRKRDMGEE